MSHARRSALAGLLVLAALLALPALAGAVPAPGLYQGNYLGSDSHHNRISLSYRSPTVRNFTIGHQISLHQGHVEGTEFGTSQNGIEFVGYWTSNHSIEGVWQYHNRHGNLITVHWSVHAISS